MSDLFSFPKQVAFNDGAILPGAKLYFFQTGTTTLQNTYQDNARATPHANPVVADADGLFEPIYLDPTLPNYRVRFTNASDVQLWQVDGVPSNQNTQQSLRLESTNPNLFLYDTDGTTGQRKYLIRANGASFQIAQSDEAEAVITTIIEFFGGVLYSGGTEVAVTSSGSFTGTLTGMTTTVTGTFYYRKINNAVFLWCQSNITGTSNTTAMTLTGLPAAIQPSTQKIVLSPELNDNGITKYGIASANGASITFGLFAITGSYVGVGTFTNSGTKGLGTGWTISYTVA